MSGEPERNALMVQKGANSYSAKLLTCEIRNHIAYGKYFWLLYWVKLYFHEKDMSCRSCSIMWACWQKSRRPERKNRQQYNPLNLNFGEVQGANWFGFDSNRQLCRCDFAKNKSRNSQNLVAWHWLFTKAISSGLLENSVSVTPPTVHT